MSYVYCGYCGERGHNKLGCPKRKEYAKENPHTYVAKQVQWEKENRKRAVASRTCTYCDQSGHNRRGCELLKSDKATVLENLKAYRSIFAAKMQATGFGVGSLVRSKSEIEPDYDVVHMITGIDWDNINTKYIEHELDGWSPLTPSEKSVFQTRIISHTFPDDYQGSYWSKPPVVMGRSNLNPARLGLVFGSELINTGQREKIVIRHNEFSKEEAAAQLLGPVKNVEIPSDFLNPKKLTTEYAMEYNFEFQNNADRYEKKRQNRFINQEQQDDAK